MAIMWGRHMVNLKSSHGSTSVGWISFAGSTQPQHRCSITSDPALLMGTLVLKMPYRQSGYHLAALVALVWCICELTRRGFCILTRRVHPSTV